MIGSLDSSQREATVIGAGIAGLLMAYRLDQLGYRVTLLEAQKRAGGLIRTQSTPFGLSESAAHSILATPAVLQLCGELGIKLITVQKGAEARYIWREGRMRRLPLKFFEALKALGSAFFSRSFGTSEGQTLEDWGRRHAGQAAVDYGLGPFLRGVYAAKPSEIHVLAAFPGLAIPRGKTAAGHLIFGRTRSGKKKQRPIMMTPALGMGALTERLSERLRDRLGERFKLGTEVSSLPQAPNLILCTPAPAAAKLLSEEDGALATRLQSIKYSSLVSLTVFIPHSAFKKDLIQGVGVLMPRQSDFKCLGVLFNSSAFSGRVSEPGIASFTMMIGGTEMPEAVTLSDHELRSLAFQELRRLFDLRSDPIHLEIHRWEHAIPRYDLHILQAWKAARQGWCSQPGRMLFGNYTGGVSLRAMIQSVSDLK